MSERKVLNKYYPPDFDPSKIPRMKLARNRQYTVRLMAPFNMRCATCGEYIYKGKKFNARKEDVENEDYLGIRIYRFYIKCTRCLQEISFKTDPQNTDYVIEAGATRNFMALKLAEEQAQREEDDLKEEEANNPMKLLENRTEQSRQEIELLESLEELKELNRRQQTVDYEGMLRQYQGETVAEREAREAKEDEDFIRSVKFANPSKRRIVVEEIIEEITEDNESATKVPKSEPTSEDNTTAVTNKSASVSSSVSKPVVKKKETWNRSIGIMSKNRLVNLVKITSKKPESSTTSAGSLLVPDSSTTNGASSLVPESSTISSASSSVTQSCTTSTASSFVPESCTTSSASSLVPESSTTSAAPSLVPGYSDSDSDNN